MITEQERPTGLMDWLKESVTVKIIFISVLILVLLIPSSMVQNLINERAGRQDDVINEVASQWSGSQLIAGPVLQIPYKAHIKSLNENNKETDKEVTKNLYLLPENLNIKASLVTQALHRGIFDVGVYSANIVLSGNFGKANLAAAGITEADLMPEKAKIIFSLSDLKGLKTNPVVKAGNQTASAEPIFSDDTLFSNGLQAAVNLTGLLNADLPFDYNLDLKGSQELHFLHLGKTTSTEVTGDWASPSFDGRYLPDERKIDNAGFSAKWRMLYYNRPFPQQWAEDNSLFKNEKKMDDATFGLKLRLPVDQYQKTTRTSKYAILIILLTFISLLLTELIRKQKIHSFNYILIGAAMIIYYILLLSFSERIGFTYAYLVASGATIALIAAFISSLLKNKLAALFFAFILAIFYAFIFVIIQLEDLALMIGSIALFAIVGVLMYFSRKINWDRN